MSTNKTQNYQLHSWVAEDKFLRSEINENFAMLDSLVVEGTYAGDGAASRVISLGFTPRAVLLLTAQCEVSASAYGYGGLALRDHPLTWHNNTVLTITEGGFQVHYGKGSSYPAASNHPEKRFHYLALK